MSGAAPMAMRVALGLVLATITFCAFLPVLEADFVNWDDPETVTKNPHLGGLGAEQIRWAFTTFHMGHYQPLSWLSLGLDDLIWDGAARGFHLTSLLLHTMNALLVYGIGLRLLSASRSARGRLGDGYDSATVLAAFVGACLFAVHPLRVESVAWVTERRDVLSSSFNLLTVLLYLGAHRRREGRGWGAWMGAAVVVFGLGLLAKVSGVTLVAVLVILDVWPLGRLGGSADWFTGRARRVWLEKIPFAMLALGAGMVAPIAQGSAHTMIPWSQHGGIERVAVFFYGLAFYLYKSLWPVSLSTLYELPTPVRPFEARFLWSAVLVAGAIAMVVLLKKRAGVSGKSVAAASLVYLAMLFPVLGLFQNGPQLVADRYSHLAMIGWTILAGWCFGWAWRNVSGWAGRAALSGSAAGVIVLLGSMTWHTAQTWRDSISLWTAALESDRMCGFCHENLAAALTVAGRTDEAMDHYREGLTHQARMDRSHFGLGRLLAERGQAAEALAHLQESIRLEPEYAGAHFEAALVLTEMRRVDEAVGHYRRAIELDDEHMGALTNLGNLLAEMGRLDEAITVYQDALAVNFRSGMVHRNLGAAYASKGDLVRGEGHARQALLTDADEPEAHYNLGIMLVRQNRREEAAEQFGKALELSRSMVRARVHFAELLAGQGQCERAKALLGEGLRERPDDERLVAALARVKGMCSRGAGGS